MTGSFQQQFTDGETQCCKTHGHGCVTAAGMQACTVDNNTGPNICRKSCVMS